MPELEDLLPLQKMSECRKRPDSITDDFGNCQHGHGKNRSRRTPHPKPEDERDNDNNGIEDKALGEKHRRYQLALDQVNSEVKPSRQERLPQGVNGQQASEEKDYRPGDRPNDRYEVEQKSDRPQRTGSPMPVSHMTIAVAIPTAAFMSVMVTRYAEISLSTC